MLDLSLTAEQKQSISQKTIQNIEILQMSAQELENYINDLVLENPVMDPDADCTDPSKTTFCLMITIYLFLPVK